MTSRVVPRSSCELIFRNTRRAYCQRSDAHSPTRVLTTEARAAFYNSSDSTVMEQIGDNTYTFTLDAAGAFAFYTIFTEPRPW